MTAWALEALASQQRHARMLEAEQERLAARARSGRARRADTGRVAATLGQLLATRREVVAR